MEIHIKVLGWLHIVLNIFAVIGGALLIIGGLFLGAGASAAARDAAPAFIFGGLGWLLGLFFIALGLPGVLLGYGLLTNKSWSRPLGIVLSILHLLNIPFGTLLGIYGLIVLFNDESRIILSQ